MERPVDIPTIVG